MQGTAIAQLAKLTQLLDALHVAHWWASAEEEVPAQPQHYPIAHMGEESTAKNAYCFRKEVSLFPLNAGKLRPHHC